MDRICDICKKENTVFFIKPGGVYVCFKCENEIREDAKRKNKKED